MNPITTSIFELFKIGPGPSSSHTIGPMKAGNDFLKEIQKLPPEALARATSVRVRLFGSLSATGRGHGTDRAVLAGLLGREPETCPSEFLDELARRPEESHPLPLGDRKLFLSGADIVFDRIDHDYPFSNTLIISLLSREGVIFEREYYSVGGGFIQWKGWQASSKGDPVYPYETMAQLKMLLDENGLDLHELILANEQAITGRSIEEIDRGLNRIVGAMENAVESGLQTSGLLPGPIGLHRKAPALYARSRDLAAEQPTNSFLVGLNAFALAASEENAAGHRIVTAPTAGAAGVIPGIIHALKYSLGRSREDINKGLLAAAAVGFLAKHNASVAGADVGCQGEVGTAASMGAALLACSSGHSFRVTENAAETALEHHLGMTCDPVGGYVQIPCIERNAMGAVKAYNAYLITAAEVPGYHLVDLDQAIRAMAETGRDMSSKYKETSLGGLAVSMVNC